MSELSLFKTKLYLAYIIITIAIGYLVNKVTEHARSITVITLVCGTLIIVLTAISDGKIQGFGLEDFKLVLSSYKTMFIKIYESIMGLHSLITGTKNIVLDLSSL